MKRDIKFRAWLKEQKRMITVYSLINMPDETFTRVFEYDEPRNYHVGRDCDLVQFTGIKDKNGVEIYSDDIMEYEPGPYKLPDVKIFRIYAIPGGFGIKGSIWNNDMSDLVPTDDLVLDSIADVQVRSWIEQNCKVIGNVFENPELLEK